MTDLLAKLPASARRWGLPDYPFRSRWFSEHGRDQHYLDEGPLDGAPVLMLHGNPTWSYYWRHLVAGLQAQYRCVAPDLGGMGFSSRPAEPFTPEGFEARAERLESLIRHLVREHSAPESGWTVVVHDWGGPIGLRWATRYPGRVSRLVILNTAAFPWPEGHRLHWGLRTIRDSALSAWISHRCNLFARGVTHLGLRGRMSRAVRAAYLAPYTRTSERRAIEQLVRAIPVGPGDAAWETVQELAADLEHLRGLPALLCWGMRDPVFTDEVLAEWLRRLPQARPCLYPDAGHLVLEDARDRVIADVREFLAATAQGTSEAVRP